MLHLSLGHSFVKQWSLQSPGLSNILSTNGIISSQVLCLTLHWDETCLTGSSFDSLGRCYNGSLWGSIEGPWDQKEERGRKTSTLFLSFLFLQYLYPALLSCAHSALHFTWMDISFTTVWHEFSLLASKVETKLTAQNSKDYLEVPGTVQNILLQNSAFSETLSPLPGIENALGSGYGVHCQK